MEWVLAALGGVAGAALLLQSRSPLPSEADFNKAKEKLKTVPDDQDSLLVMGKYYAFVLGDYPEGMKYFAQTSDKTLRTLAEHERAPLYTDTAAQKVGMGDEWVTAAKSYPGLFRVFYDRAAQWYASAWPNLEGPWRDKGRERGRKMAASRPPGAPRGNLPAGWSVWKEAAGTKLPVMDGTIAHSGSYSIKLVPPDEKVAGSHTALRTELMPISGKEMEFSAYVFTDGTENAADQVRVYFIDGAGQYINGALGPFVPVDTPFWTRIAVKLPIPDNAARTHFAAVQFSRKGNMWLDDVSAKVDGKEILKNTSFENK